MCHMPHNSDSRTSWRRSQRRHSRRTSPTRCLLSLGPSLSLRLLTAPSSPLTATSQALCCSPRALHCPPSPCPQAAFYDAFQFGRVMDLQKSVPRVSGPGGQGERCRLTWTDHGCPVVVQYPADLSLPSLIPCSIETWAVGLWVCVWEGLVQQSSTKGLQAATIQLHVVKAGFGLLTGNCSTWAGAWGYTWPGCVQQRVVTGLSCEKGWEGSLTVQPWVFNFAIG